MKFAYCKHCKHLIDMDSEDFKEGPCPKCPMKRRERVMKDLLTALLVMFLASSFIWLILYVIINP